MYDVILVLGYLVDEKGNLPKEQILRINKGLELFNKNKAKYIIVSGGFGKRFNRTKKSLAWHMKKFAIENDIPPKKIFTENKSHDTVDNMAFSKKIIQRHRWKSAIVVSSKYHIPRIKLICSYVFDKKFKLSFVGVKTENDNKKKIIKNERIYASENERLLKAIYS